MFSSGLAFCITPYYNDNYKSKERYANEKWLIHDGLLTFGIGIHSGGNELLREKYNVVTMYTLTPEKYHGFFEALDIPYAADLNTAWDYFTMDLPGDSFALTIDGIDIYDLVEHMKQYGLYFAERRET